MFRKTPKCPLLSAGVTEVDYKDLDLLRRYVSDEWSIVPAGVNNISRKMQRQLTVAIKRARHLSLMAVTRRHHLSVDKPSAADNGE